MPIRTQVPPEFLLDTILSIYASVFMLTDPRSQMVAAPSDSQSKTQAEPRPGKGMEKAQHFLFARPGLFILERILLWDLHVLWPMAPWSCKNLPIKEGKENWAVQMDFVGPRVNHLKWAKFVLETPSLALGLSLSEVHKTPKVTSNNFVTLDMESRL